MKYNPIPRTTTGQPDKVANAKILTDLSTLDLWRWELLRSGHPLDGLPLPPTADGISAYNAERADRIKKMTSAEIGNHCRKYGVKMHGRQCPSFF